MLYKSEQIHHTANTASSKGLLVLLLVFINGIILKIAFVQNPNWYNALYITLPLLFAAILFKQKKDNGVRPFPKE